MLMHSLDVELDRFPDELQGFLLRFTGGHAARKIRNVGAEPGRGPVHEDCKSHDGLPLFKANPPAFECFVRFSDPDPVILCLRWSLSQVWSDDDIADGFPSDVRGPTRPARPI
jgi:hypothetical protein